MWHAWGKGEVFYRVLVGRPEGRRLLERPRHRWEDNIKMDLREVGFDGANWIQVAFVNTVMTFGFHKERLFFEKLCDYWLFK
jgi:hypothetical protein